jgi:hypothetical protein
MRRGRRSSENRVKPVRRGAGRLETDAPFPFLAMKIFLCSHLVTLRWQGRATIANLERISSKVATVNSEEPIPLSETVTISTEDCELRGTVIRTALEMSGHEIDIALETNWSTEVFVPDHLFDPDVMIAP